MKLFFHGRPLVKGEHAICERCKTKKNYPDMVWSATLIQFSQGGKNLHTALIRYCDDCKSKDTKNSFIEGFQGAPDCGGECCTGKVERAPWARFGREVRA